MSAEMGTGPPDESLLGFSQKGLACAHSHWGSQREGGGHLVTRHHESILEGRGCALTL